MRPLFALLLATAFLSPLHAQTTCGWNPDSNGDYLVTVADLLALLSVFEEADTDMDGIFDSMDDCVGSYDACGVCNGTGVDADTDGVCDDVDLCVGALDACGLCNGPGPTVPVIDEIVFMTDSVYLPPLQQWYVFSYAVDTLYTYVCPVLGCTDANAANFNPLAVIEDGSCTYGPAQCGGASTVTFDGYTYALVAIGTQCWFAENLRSDNYRNGDAIPGNLSDAQWTSTSSGAQTVYGEGSSTVNDGSSDEVANLATYGRLYNWYAVNDSRGLCPSGFHVPSDGEWTVLENALGGSSVAGAALKASSPAWDGTNSSGFSALPGGARYDGLGYFYDQGYGGGWWSSSPSGAGAWHRSLFSGGSDVYRYSPITRYGLSVRCVRDSETDACLDPDGDGVCTENEVSGCTDSTASNFNPAATESDESCEYPSPAQCGGATTVTFDGHTYGLVAIGTQCWFAENLRSDNYRNGDAIPGNLSDAQWTSTSSGAQTVYGEGSSAVYQGSSDEVTNLATYGRLYNWYAVNDARGLCPSGFHVPSDGEWTVLENALGGSSVAGTALKAASPAWDGTNSSGFSALPGGYRNGHSAYFNDQGNYGYWRSSSPVGTDAWTRDLVSGASDVFRNNYGYPRHGFSVRCVRDSETDACLDPDGDGVCAENEVSGCSDSAASNFNPAATEADESSCVYPGPAQCGGATTVSFDGHTYALVAIGTQCWFAENLRSDNYRNGDAIPGGLNNSQWTSTVSGAQAFYNNDSGSLATYGRLYNWYAVNDSRGLCPSGFHVPSDGEWTVLEIELGGSFVAGSAMKAASPAWNGTNSSGFSALPGGYRGSGSGVFLHQGNYGNWWSSSLGGANAWLRYVGSGASEVFRGADILRSGFSVRCVRD